MSRLDPRAGRWSNRFAVSTTKAADVRVVEDGSDGLRVFEIDGKMTEDAVAQVFAAFDRAIDVHDKINLMLPVQDYAGFDPGLLGDRDTMTSKFGAIGKSTATPSSTRRDRWVGASGRPTLNA